MKVTVWNENIHEKEMPEVLGNYPGGLHGYIAGFLKSDEVKYGPRLWMIRSVDLQRKY